MSTRSGRKKVWKCFRGGSSELYYENLVGFGFRANKYSVNLLVVVIQARDDHKICINKLAEIDHRRCLQTTRTRCRTKVWLQIKELKQQTYLGKQRNFKTDWRLEIRRDCCCKEKKKIVSGKAGKTWGNTRDGIAQLETVQKIRLIDIKSFAQVIRSSTMFMVNMDAVRRQGLGCWKAAGSVLFGQVSK